jgi:acylphosphatase
MLQTISITVTGKVQGVYYRQSAKEKALELDVTGIVRNLPDESVCIIATGSAEQLQALVEWCWQGPRRAQVKNVEVEKSALQSFDTFSIGR